MLLAREPQSLVWTGKPVASGGGMAEQGDGGSRGYVPRARTVERLGQAEAAIMDILDYRILRAVSAYYALAPHPAPISDPALEPAGLSDADVQRAREGPDGSPQAPWDMVLAAYFDGHISLSRAATLLDLSSYGLDERLRRLGVARRIGPETVEGARTDAAVALSVGPG